MWHCSVGTEYMRYMDYILSVRLGASEIGHTENSFQCLSRLMAKLFYCWSLKLLKKENYGQSSFGHRDSVGRSSARPRPKFSL